MSARPPEAAPAAGPEAAPAVPAPSPNLIGQRLLAAGLIAAADLERALSVPRRPGERLGAVLVRLGALSEDNLLLVLQQQTGMDVVVAEQLPRSLVDAGLGRLGLDVQRLQDLQCIVWQDDQQALHAAAEDPLLVDRREIVETAAGAQPVCWHFIRARELERVLAGLARASGNNELDAARWRELAEDGPVIAFVNDLIAQAIDARASDIHVEPGDLRCELRLRVDGVLHTRSDFPIDRYPAIASRIKLIAGLDIAERRLPQDGRVTVRAAGVDMDLRVSVIPAVHGESIVMRLLPKERQHLGLDRLGLEPDHLRTLGEWLDRPSGLVLVTGPTGSGKSTTLYSALAAVDDRSRKILTVEDPVEFRLPGVIQVQVMADIGYTFARALRAFLRHDPDIIMVGEIRDRETAEIAVQSALTGHLVLATLHTNDALSAFTRLVDMGIEPYLVAAAVQAVMAQRLVRRLCDDCAVEAGPPPDARAPELAAGRWRSAGGCPRCQGTGYRGRLGIYELVTVSAALQHAVASGAPLAEIERIADAEGRRSLRGDGLLKASRGVTTVAEVARVAGEAVLEADAAAA
ncbi:GspE/PulE family protein [Rubrivivax sp. JA1024]|nr:GspE/PulE family protein [Rubrivivax sp. JA1024]